MTPAEALHDRSIARSEALLLLAHASGRARESLLASPEVALTAAQADRYRELRDRRAAGEPVAYLLGYREFYGRAFSVGPDVLIPRPETELLIDLAIARCAGTRPRILDLGTGCGCIAITLALEIAGARVAGTDRSARALAVAEANAATLGAVVGWHLGSWFDALADARVDTIAAAPAFDLIVSNPPYIAAQDPHLGEGDLRFEPSSALTDGHDGLSALRCIATESTTRLHRGGTLMVEHGHGQAKAVRELFAGAGLKEIASVRDLAGIERATVGRRG